jgi:hypothetical protein
MMNMLVGTAIAGTAIASRPAIAASDPIFAAIDAHRATVAARNLSIDVHCELEGELPKDKRQSNIDAWEEKIVATDDPRWIDSERSVNRAWDAEEDAAVAILHVRPTTLAGVIALLEYANEADTDGETWPVDLDSEDGTINRNWHYFLIESLAETLSTLAAA